MTFFFSSGFLQEAVFDLRRSRRSQQSVHLAGLLQPVLLRQSVAGALHRVGLLLQSQRAERRNTQHQHNYQPVLLLAFIKL